jgi:hypothetical protein
MTYFGGRVSGEVPDGGLPATAAVQSWDACDLALTKEGSPALVPIVARLDAV